MIFHKVKYLADIKTQHVDNILKYFLSTVVDYLIQSHVFPLPTTKLEVDAVKLQRKDDK